MTFKGNKAVYTFENDRHKKVKSLLKGKSGGSIDYKLSQAQKADVPKPAQEFAPTNWKGGPNTSGNVGGSISSLDNINFGTKRKQKNAKLTI